MKKNRPKAIVRVRFMAFGLAAVALCIAGPLLLVWKQAYITGISMKNEALTDTVSALNRKIATLQLLRDRLSSNERIERVARTVMGLEYPSSDRIVIVQVNGKRERHGLVGGIEEIIALLRKQTGKGGGT